MLRSSADDRHSHASSLRYITQPPQNLKSRRSCLTLTWANDGEKEEFHERMRLSVGHQDDEVANASAAGVCCRGRFCCPPGVSGPQVGVSSPSPRTPDRDGDRETETHSDAGAGRFAGAVRRARDGIRRRTSCPLHTWYIETRRTRSFIAYDTQAKTALIHHHLLNI